MEAQLINEAKDFSEKIKKSEVYLHYLTSKNLLQQKPILKAQLDDFRRNSFEIQIGHNYGFYNCYEQLVNLKNVNDELLSNALVKELMEAEIKLTKMVSKVINCIAEEIDFEIDFLD